MICVDNNYVVFGHIVSIYTLCQYSSGVGLVLIFKRDDTNHPSIYVIDTTNLKLSD